MSEIIELTSKWYKWVGLSHHKDRDCHWYIETDYAYGEKPKYTAFHYGYIFSEDNKKIERDTIQEAEKDLLQLIKEAIDSQKEWVDRCLANKKEYDTDTIEQAEEYYRIFNN